MLPASRVAAAIDVLADIMVHRRPASDALKDWGLKNRYAGSKDRAAVASLVYDSLRCKASSAFILGEETPRAFVMCMLWQKQVDKLEDLDLLFNGERHAPPALSADERDKLSSARLDEAPEYVRANCPEWLYEHFHQMFGEATVDEVAALAERATLDVRVNTLKADWSDISDAFSHLKHEETKISNYGIRFNQLPSGQAPSLESEGSFRLGGFEIQDEGSQIVSLLAGAKPHELVIDLCAGAGGKSLALAAFMNNEGSIHATDIERRRLGPLYERKERAGATCISVHPPADSGREPLAHLFGKADLVVLDAPCTGTGVWRRNPDAKWRLRPNSLQKRIDEQTRVLERGAGFVKSGGRMAYITCSMLRSENDDRIAAFLDAHPEFTSVPIDDVIKDTPHVDLQGRFHRTQYGLLLTPLRTGTDGFYFSMLRKQ